MFSQQDYQDIIGYLRNHLPEEACGQIGCMPDNSYHIYYVNNIAETPRTRYDVSPHDLIRVQKEMRLNGENLAAIFHSHPETEAYPSATDVSKAFYPEALYIIFSFQYPYEPYARGFYIRDGEITEEEISIEKDA